jgi:ribosomal protein L37E
MAPRSKKLNELLNDLECDVEKEDGSLKQQNTQKVSGININIGDIGDNNSISIGNSSTAVSHKPNDRHTINCKACGHVVAKAAKSCPHCGQPTRTSRLKQHILLGVMLLAPLVTSPTPLFGFLH